MEKTEKLSLDLQSSNLSCLLPLLSTSSACCCSCTPLCTALSRFSSSSFSFLSRSCNSLCSVLKRNREQWNPSNERYVQLTGQLCCPKRHVLTLNLSSLSLSTQHSLRKFSPVLFESLLSHVVTVHVPLLGLVHVLLKGGKSFICAEGRQI